MASCCVQFVQNTWRKDLCSNCFKSKEEHASPTVSIAVVQLSASITVTTAPLQSILKGNSGQRKKVLKVHFTSDEFQVIGFGGEDPCTDGDGEVQSSGVVGGNGGDEEEGEEEKALALLTKANTELNASIGRTQLLLGQKQTDAEGKRKTPLLVTVQPFGHHAINRKAVINTSNKNTSHQNDSEKRDNEKNGVKSVIKYSNTGEIIMNSCSPVKDSEAVLATLDAAKAKEKTNLENETIAKNRLGSNVEAKPAAIKCDNGIDGRKSGIVRGSILTDQARTKRLSATANKVTLDNLSVELAANEAIDLVTNITVPEIRDTVELIVTEKIVNSSAIVTEEKDKMLSRELAGEPDGRADSDDCEVPALPLSPPPRPSFLHSHKPTLPAKPRLPLPIAKVENCDTELNKPQTLLFNENGRTKRQAPLPPPSALLDLKLPFTDAIADPNLLENGKPEQDQVFGRTSQMDCVELSMVEEPNAVKSGVEDTAAIVTEGSPVKGRSISCSPLPGIVPEHAVTDRRLSLSEENMKLGRATTTTRVRVKLRKLLRLGSKEEEPVNPPPPRPRPLIIHPLDLNKTAIQVLRPKGDLESPTTPTSPSHILSGRPGKPPPPPRGHATLDSTAVSAMPADSSRVYANIGEGRSGITPAKPQRTGSLRSMDTDDYDALQRRSSVCSDGENVYELVNLGAPPLPFSDTQADPDIYYYCSFKHKGWRKGPSIVHRSLEENYGAVVIANHEALTKLLHQVVSGSGGLVRAPKGADSLRWSDLKVVTDGVRCGGAVFVGAEWGAGRVTLCLVPPQARLPPALQTVAQFTDLVPAALLSVTHSCDTNTQALIGVLGFRSVVSLASFSAAVGSNEKESGLLVLQLIGALKGLQARGLEEADLADCIVAREEHDPSPRLVLLTQYPEQGVKGSSLCHCALIGASQLLPSGLLLTLLTSVLSSERANSLSVSKACVELWLWGPEDCSVPATADRAATLQRWLDLERATLLHSLVASRPQRLTTLQYCHLAFLATTNAKSIAEASLLLNQTNECMQEFPSQT